MYLYTAFSPAYGPTILATLPSITRPGECTTSSSILDSKPAAGTFVGRAWIVNHAFCKDFPCPSPIFKGGFSADGGQIVYNTPLCRDIFESPNDQMISPNDYTTGDLY